MEKFPVTLGGFVCCLCFLWPFHTDHAHAVAGRFGDGFFNTHSTAQSASQSSKGNSCFIGNVVDISDNIVPNDGHGNSSIPDVPLMSRPVNVLLDVVSVIVDSVNLHPVFKNIFEVFKERFKGSVTGVIGYTSTAVMFEVGSVLGIASGFHTFPASPHCCRLSIGLYAGSTMRSCFLSSDFFAKASTGKYASSEVGFLDQRDVPTVAFADQIIEVTSRDAETCEFPANPLHVSVNPSAACPDVSLEIGIVNFFLNSTRASA